MTLTVIVTRPKGAFAGEDRLAARLESLGLSATTLSSLSIKRVDLTTEERGAISALFFGGDLWISLLSPTSASIFSQLCKEIGCDTSQKNVHFASQGPGTSETIRSLFQREVEIEAERSTAESFAETFQRGVSRGSRVLVPQSAEGRDVFGPMLSKGGFQVMCVTTYGLETLSPTLEEIEFVTQCSPSDTVILFMSPSAVRATVETFPALDHLKQLRAISIGPSTSAAITASGLTLFREAKEHTEEGVVECLREVCQG